MRSGSFRFDEGGDSGGVTGPNRAAILFFNWPVEPQKQQAEWVSKPQGAGGDPVIHTRDALGKIHSWMSSVNACTIHPHGQFWGKKQEAYLSSAPPEKTLQQ